MKGRVFILVIAVILGVVSIIIMGVTRLRSGPNWLLTTSNTEAGVTVIVTDTLSPTPIYTVQIVGKSTMQPIKSTLRTQISSPDVKTLFHDETLPPGRWTLKLNDTKIDIMPARIIINDKIEGEPGSKLKVN